MELIDHQPHYDCVCDCFDQERGYCNCEGGYVYLIYDPNFEYQYYYVIFRKIEGIIKPFTPNENPLDENKYEPTRTNFLHLVAYYLGTRELYPEQDFREYPDDHYRELLGYNCETEQFAYNEQEQEKEATNGKNLSYYFDNEQLKTHYLRSIYKKDNGKD